MYIGNQDFVSLIVHLKNMVNEIIKLIKTTNQSVIQNY